MGFYLIKGSDVASYKPKQHLYLIEPVLPAGGHAVMHGAPAHGKTQLATTLALDIAAGTPFMDRLATVQGNVMHVQADMAEATVHDRLMKIERAMPGRLSGVDVVFSDQQFDILDSGVQRILREHVERIQPSLIIVDTLRKTHRLDENLSSTPSTIYSAWRDVAGPMPAMMYLHHNKKPNMQFPGSAADELRGSSAWLADADLGIYIKKVGEKGPFVVSWSKSRTFDPDEVGKQFTLHMDSRTLLLSAISAVDVYLRDAMKRQLPKEQVAVALQDESRFGKEAVSKATAYRRLADWDERLREAA